MKNPGAAMRRIATAAVLAASALAFGCALGNPQVSRDRRDPINEVESTVEISRAAEKVTTNPATGEVTVEPVRGVNGTYWGSQVGKSNMDSTQKLEHDTANREVALGITSIASRENLTDNHVQCVKYLAGFGYMVADRENLRSHEFTITAMQDPDAAARATIAKYNNQRAAMANANAELTDTADLALELFAPPTPGSYAAAAKKGVGALAGLAQSLGMTEGELASAAKSNPKLADALVDLAGEPGYIDGSLTVEQLKRAQDDLLEIIKKGVETSDAIQEIKDPPSDESEADALAKALDDAIARKAAEAEAKAAAQAATTGTASGSP